MVGNILGMGQVLEVALMIHTGDLRTKNLDSALQLTNRNQRSVI